MQMLSVEKDSAVCCLVFRVGDGGSAWEILRGFEWGVGWYAMCPVPTTKQDGFTLKISQYLSKIPTCAANSTPARRRGHQILQTNHKACSHSGTPNKTLKTSQYLSKTPTCAAP